MPTSLLLGPAAREVILGITFVDPEREFHLRELMRRTGLAPRTVQLELDRLVGADLLRERRDGNRRYVRANATHTLFRPVREIVLKTAGLADVLREALGQERVELALVFGSMASGTNKAGSDVDLLVVTEMGLREVSRRLRAAHDALGREINPVVWTSAEFDRRRSRHDAFLRRILSEPVVPIIGQIP